MNRILVMGVSAGVGKSTFAKSLGEIVGINVYHLDTFYWKPNWVEATKEEFESAQQKIIHQDEWIIDGNYQNTYELRAKQADTIIYLDLPLMICLYRVFKRWILNIGKTRPDIGEGCKEKLDYSFIKFICTTYYPRKRKMAERFQKFEEMGPNKKIIILKGKKEIRMFLESFVK